MAASCQPSALADFAMSAMRWANLPASRGSPMTPVEEQNTSSAPQPAAFAACSTVTRTASRPFMPVKALALPELTTSARARPDFRLSRHLSTAAERVFERVRTPATVVPGANSASIRSVRPLYLMPASRVAKRTPSMAGMAGSAASANGDGLAE